MSGVKDQDEGFYRTRGFGNGGASDDPSWAVVRALDLGCSPGGVLDVCRDGFERMVSSVGRVRLVGCGLPFTGI